MCNAIINLFTTILLYVSIPTREMITLKRVILAMLFVVLLTSCTKAIDFSSETEVAKSYYEHLYDDNESTDFCSDYIYPGNDKLCESAKDMFYNSETRAMHSVVSASVDETFEASRENQTLVIVTLSYQNDEGYIEYTSNVLLAYVDERWTIVSESVPDQSDN